MKEFTTVAGDDSDTEVEQEFDDDEESLLLRDAARLKADVRGMPQRWCSGATERRYGTQLREGECLSSECTEMNDERVV